MRMFVGVPWQGPQTTVGSPKSLFFVISVIFRSFFVISSFRSPYLQRLRFGEFLADSIVRFINLFTYLLRTFRPSANITIQRGGWNGLVVETDDNEQEEKDDDVDNDDDAGRSSVVDRLRVVLVPSLMTAVLGPLSSGMCRMLLNCDARTRSDW